MISTKNSQGFAAVEAILIVIVLGIIGFTGWFVYHSKQATDKTLNQVGTSSTPEKTQKKQSTPAITYTSKTEQATFSYPSDWTKVAASIESQDPTADTLGLKSPDGTLTISWVPGIGGLGGACDGDIPVTMAVDSDGMGPCPDSIVTEATPIAGASGLYVASGYITSDGKTFHPWMAVQEQSGTKSQRELGVEVYPGKHSDAGVVFAIGNISKGKNTPSFSSGTQAKAFFDTANAKAAKQILLSLKY